MRVLRWVFTALVLPAGLAVAPAQAQTGGSAVLKIISGAASRDIAVDVNRAVVVEADEPFAEVSVAQPNIADVAALSNRTIYILGKAPGYTSLTLLGNGGRLIANVNVHVTPDLAEFKSRLREILPGEKIEVRTANDGIVLSGTVSGVTRLARAMELAERYAPGRVSNMMSVGGSQQVMLKVRFAEVQRNATKELGFNWSFGVGFGNFGVSASTGDYLSAINRPGIPANGGLDTGYRPSGDTNGVLRLGYAAGGIIANLAIDALEGKGAARTLAEPTLVALSGDAASFLAGGEYPVPIIDDNGGIAVEYRPFGVGLAFTPTVLDDKLINLQIEASTSAIDPAIVIETDGIRYNGFATRRAKTTLELRDGESFALAGLLQDEFFDNTSQIPWIGDVPVIGTLFRSADYRRRQSELVTSVTVHRVTPVPEESLSLPTDRFQMPSESDLLLFGRLEGDPAMQEIAGKDFEGPFGYVME